MGDPGFVAGLIGYALAKTIEKVIESASHAITVRKRCRIIAKTLNKVLPRLRTIREQLISGERRYEGPVEDWLASLNEAVEEASREVHKCNSKSWNIIEVVELSKKLKELNAKIEKLVEKDLDFSLHCETHERLSRIECGIAGLRRHSFPDITSTSFNDYHTQVLTSFQPDVAPHHHLYSSVGSQSLNYTAQGHSNMHNSVDPHPLHYTAQGWHRPAVQKIASLDAIHQTRLEAMRREEETRRREEETRWRDLQQ